MEDWAEIRRLHRTEDMPIKAIARRMGISKNTTLRRGRRMTVDGESAYVSFEF